MRASICQAQRCAHTHRQIDVSIEGVVLLQRNEQVKEPVQRGVGDMVEVGLGHCRGRRLRAEVAGADVERHLPARHRRPGGCQRRHLRQRHCPQTRVEHRTSETERNNSPTHFFLLLLLMLLMLMLMLLLVVVVVVVVAVGTCCCLGPEVGSP